VRRSYARCAHAFVPDTPFLCHAVAHQHAAGRGRASARAEAPQLRASTVSASLPPPPPLGKLGEQADHAHEQRIDHHIHRPRDAVPGAARVEPRTQFSLQDGKTLGRVGGVGFHV